MSRINDSLSELSSTGVQFRPIGELASVGTGSSDRKDATEDGEYPFYVRSKDVMRKDSYEFNEEAILIPGEGGIGEIFHYVCGKYALHQRAYRIRFNTSDVDTRFAYYYFRANFKKFILAKAVSATVTSIRKPMITEFRIPIPPVSVQREIVCLLDSFSALEAGLETELEAELGARRLQYAYYRDSMLTFGDDVDSIPMGDLGVIFGGLTGKSKRDFSDGNARFVSYVNVFNNAAVDVAAGDFVQIETGERQRSLQRGDILFTGSSETPNDVAVSSVVTSEVTEPLYLNSFCIGFRLADPSVLDPEFSKHLFRSGGLRKQLVRTANGVTRFNVSKAQLAKVQVPIPAISEQRRIAGLLDSFQTLVDGLSNYLPAELRARRVQYEHYLDKLLTFDEAVA